MSKTKSYWRGYIDIQGVSQDDVPYAVAKRPKKLQPLADLLGAEIEEYRSGYRVGVPKLNKKLPLENSREYAQGMFAARGQVYRDVRENFKITLTGRDAQSFVDIIQDNLKIELPELQQPSKTSQTMRLTVTGEKARDIYSWLKKDKNK